MTYCERDCDPMSVFDASCPCHEAAVRLSSTETNEQSRSRVSGTRERQKANEGDEMSDYVSEDRLDEISRRFNATFDELDSRDVHWLIAEVRRMREEHSDHTAAKYWRTIQAQRQMIERQAETIERMESALKAIAGDKCMRLTSGNCWTDYERDAEYLADRWCDACIAADGLRGES